MTEPVSIKGRACIAGVGETRYVRGTDRTALELALEASLRAIDDAGMAASDVDAVIVPGGGGSGGAAGDFCANLGVRTLRYSASLEDMGGAMCIGAVETAVMVIAAGVARHVLIPHGNLAYSAFRRHGHAAGSAARAPAKDDCVSDYYAPFGAAPMPYLNAWLAQRHMSLYGTTHAQFGAVAMAMRRHACLNPAALMYGKPITMQDYLASRWISHPYRLLDCSLDSDGAAALLMTSAERARDMRHAPVHVVGIASGHLHPTDDIANRPDVLEIGLELAAPRAFAMAGLRPADMDFAQIYDCFTGHTILQLEAAGFCAKGEGGPFVENGRIELGGDMPVNTHGGLLSHAHATGMNHLVEAVIQLRGDGGARQVRNAEAGIVTGWGRHTQGAIAILRR